jgi:hypothetical protein
MTSNEQIISDLHKNTDNLLQLLLGFEADKFLMKPGEKEWSAAEVAEHLLLIERNVSKALAGKALPTERPYDQKLTVLATFLSDLEGKINAPEVVKPVAVSHNRQEMIEELKKLRQGHADLVPGMDLSETCMDFKHPMLGTLTRYEWIYFDIYHADRHLHQLRRIASTVG